MNRLLCDCGSGLPVFEGACPGCYTPNATTGTAGVRAQASTRQTDGPERFSARKGPGADLDREHEPATVDHAATSSPERGLFHEHA